MEKAKEKFVRLEKSENLRAARVIEHRIYDLTWSGRSEGSGNCFVESFVEF
jgi:hypothetical protein